MMLAVGKSPEESRSYRICMALYRILLLPAYAVGLAAWALVPFRRGRLNARLGLGAERRHGGTLIWFHASSVGEISTIAPIVSEVRRLRPDHAVVVTTMTAGGMRRARALIESADISLVPFDFHQSMRRVMNSRRPTALVIGETEIWPNMIVEAKNVGARVALVNGRISTKSYPRYRLIRPLIGGVLRGFDRLIMRTPIDAERVVQLGADPRKVEVAGNIKYDVLPGPLPADSRLRIKQSLGLNATTQVITLGSVRQGEAQIMLSALRSIEVNPCPVIVVAPRHMASVGEIQQAARDYGFSSETLTGGPLKRDGASRPDVIIIAEMGRLIEMYAISDVAVVGGTFRSFGGHNPLEPASQGAVTVVGPYTQNIYDDIEYLRSRGGVVVADGSNLGALITEILRDPRKIEQTGRNAALAVEARKGIARRCVQKLLDSGVIP